MSAGITKKERVDELLSRGVEEVIERAHLTKALLGSKKLRVKFGIDPTGPKVHIGRAIPLWKLRAFQDLGHKIVLIIGDFTAQIGDASDKLKKRPFLTRTEVKKNLKGYLPQIGRIIDLKKTEVRYNSEWLEKLNFREISQLAEIFTAQQMIKRRNFKERWDSEVDITLREFMYPIMQGYDSVAVKADVELGGSDQLFNLLAGRKIQEWYGQKPQDVMTTQMLHGTDGRKMSTSWGNVVNVTDKPDDQYGKVMAMRDEVMIEYFRLVTDVPEAEIRKYERDLRGGKVNPKMIKETLASAVVERYHGKEAALRAQGRFTKIFSKKDLSGTLPGLKPQKRTLSVLELVMETGIPTSGSAAVRLIEQGGVKLDDAPLRDPKESISPEKGSVLRIGKKHLWRIS